MVSEIRMSVVKITIAHGADVHGRSRKSALFKASRYSDSIIVSLLINNGANPNPIVQHVAHAPIYQSIDNRNPNISELPIKRGADVNARDLENGCAVTHQATINEYGFMISGLLEASGQNRHLGQ
jgi:ankyrin repeat protein